MVVLVWLNCIFMSSPLPLSLYLNPPLHSHLHPKSYSLLFSLSRSRTSTFQVRATNIHIHSDREEIRWLREEQRWLREEQRWLREEQRWIRERESLLRQIADLKLEIQALQNRHNISEGVSVSDTIACLLKVLEEKNLIAERGIVVEEKEKKEKDEVEEEEQEQEQMESQEKKWKALRKGSEGEEVKAMQEALNKLGFYSGEGDMEFSSFSSGTERAVKTWQATVGASEDGIMTSELLERLYMKHQIEDAGIIINTDHKGATRTVPLKEGVNGAAVASVTGISELQQKAVNEQGVTEVEVSEQRVFLLGENRWEEPSRLAGREKQTIGRKPRDTATKCLCCRGEGRLMCTECDGTGEPNVEPQFLEWVDEGAKCPYCEGLGYTICDVCEGKTVV